MPDAVLSLPATGKIGLDPVEASAMSAASAACVGSLDQTIKRKTATVIPSGGAADVSNMSACTTAAGKPEVQLSMWLRVETLLE